MGLSSLLPPLCPWRVFAWTPTFRAQLGALLLGDLRSPQPLRGSRHWRAAALSSLQGGPWAGQELPSRIRCLERRCPLSRQALGESDYDFPPCVTSLPARVQSSPASALKGAKSDSPLPENNKPVFHDPFSRRPPRGIESLSKAGPAASALPRPLPGSPTPATAVPSWGMTSTMTFIHHTEAPLSLDSPAAALQPLQLGSDSTAVPPCAPQVTTPRRRPRGRAASRR